MSQVALWPDETQVLLLKAALGEDERALEAFSAWRERVDIDGVLDDGSFRLLPLAYANLSRLGCQDELMGRLRGVYRHSWCEAQAHLATAGDVAGLLAARGIRVLTSKGLALGQDYYASPALRPMSDIDFIVAADRAEDAIEALAAGGWAPEIHVNWVERRQDMLVVESQVMCQRPGKGELDLHWRVMAEVASGEIDARFWAGAEAFEVGGQRLWRPCPTDLLFHVVVHGLKRNPMPPLRWVADAAMILRRADVAIDWAGMIAFARRQRLGHRLSLGLSYLHDTLGLDIPQEARAPAAPGLVERLENRLFLEDTSAWTGRRRELIGRVQKGVRLLISDQRRHLPRLGVRYMARRLGVWSGA